MNYRYLQQVRILIWKDLNTGQNVFSTYIYTKVSLVGQERTLTHARRLIFNYVPTQLNYQFALSFLAYLISRVMKWTIHARQEF